MRLSDENKTKLRDFLFPQLGKPYVFGVEGDDVVLKSWDCSELVEHAFMFIGVKVPDGARYQFDASRPLEKNESPDTGDVGFSKKPGQPAHHVVLIYDDSMCIEARGDPINKVILTPKKKWEAWKYFTGWRRFNVFG